LNLGQTGLTTYYDPITFAYDLCQCPAQPRHYWNDQQHKCLLCPQGAVCDSSVIAVIEPITNILSADPRAIVIDHNWYPLCDGHVCDGVNTWPEPIIIECYVPGLCTVSRLPFFVHRHSLTLQLHCLYRWCW
jgi:hypothetical protein